MGEGKFSKRLSYTLIVISAVILIGVGVYAYGTNSPSTFGHSIGEIAAPSGCATGQFLKWTGSAWNCAGAGSNIQVIKGATTVGGTTTLYVYCPTGMKLTGGGCEGGLNGIIASYPDEVNPVWICKFVSNSIVNTGYAICST